MRLSTDVTPGADQAARSASIVQEGVTPETKSPLSLYGEARDALALQPVRPLRIRALKVVRRA